MSTLGLPFYTEIWTETIPATGKALQFLSLHGNYTQQNHVYHRGTVLGDGLNTNRTN